MISSIFLGQFYSNVSFCQQSKIWDLRMNFWRISFLEILLLHITIVIIIVMVIVIVIVIFVMMMTVMMMVMMMILGDLYLSVIHLISPGCLRPIIALQVQSRGLKHNSFYCQQSLPIYTFIWRYWYWLRYTVLYEAMYGDLSGCTRSVVLNGINLYSVVLVCTQLYSFVLSCTQLYSVVPSCTQLCPVVLRCTQLHILPA